MEIGKDTFAALAYTLRYENEDGDIIEQYTEDNPVEVLMGHDLMLEILEKNLHGLTQDDRFEFIITPDQGYGEYDENKLVEVPSKDLLAEVPAGQNAGFEEGDIIPIRDMEGKEYEALVLEKKKDTVVLDLNHPLAGETLHFCGKVLMVRKATEEEIREIEAEEQALGL